MGFFENLKKSLTKTRQNFTDRISELVGASAKIDEDCLDELEMITGGDVWNHIIGAVTGMSVGALVGGLVGGAVSSGMGAPVGMMIGAPVGAVAGGIVGIRDILETADSGMQKLLDLF